MSILRLRKKQIKADRMGGQPHLRLALARSLEESLAPPGTARALNEPGQLFLGLPWKFLVYFIEINHIHPRSLLESLP